MSTPERFSYETSRVKAANFSIVRSNGDHFRPQNTDIFREIDAAESPEPSNVDDILLTGTSLSFKQYGVRKDNENTHQAFAWETVFDVKAMKDLTLQEYAMEYKGYQNTYIEVKFRYEVHPRGQNVSQPMDDQVALGLDYSDGKPYDPEEYPVASLFKQEGTIPCTVRLGFLRSKSQKKPYWWNWPAVCAFLSGWNHWTPHTKKAETERLMKLGLNEWINAFSNTAAFPPARFSMSQNEAWALSADKPERGLQKSIAANLPLLQASASAPQPQPQPAVPQEQKALMALSNREAVNETKAYAAQLRAERYGKRQNMFRRHDMEEKTLLAQQRADLQALRLRHQAEWDATFKHHEAGDK